MKLLLVNLLVSVLVTVIALPSNSISPRLVTDEYGNLVPIPEYFLTVSEVQSESETVAAAAAFVAATDVIYTLYTRANSAGESLYTSGGLIASNFGPLDETKILVHGWNTDGLSTDYLNIKDAYLTLNDYNVIIVDWSGGNLNRNYWDQRVLVEDVGIALANIITDLQVPLASVTVVGHSLGGHVASYTGKTLKQGGVPTLGTIVGLDATWVDFGDETGRLNKTDAIFVQGLHTSGLGFIIPYGHADYWPAYGDKQNGCGWDLLHGCSHNRALLYFREAILASVDGSTGLDFVGRRCFSYVDIEKKNCRTTGANTRFGESPFDTAASGWYYFSTNAASPFAKGIGGA